MKIKDITLIAILTTILFVQEQLLSFIPNVQLTVFLLVIYSKVLDFKKTSIIVLLHTLLDNIINGSMNIIYFPFMLLGWMLIPIFITTVFKKTENSLILGLIGIAFSFIYCWLFMIPQIIIYNVNIFEYLLSDLFFEIALAISSFLTILWLYGVTSKFLRNILKKYNMN